MALGGLTGSATRTFGPHAGQGAFDGVSPAVRDLPVLPAQPTPQPAERNVEITPRGTPVQVTDPAVQTAPGKDPAPAPQLSFDGICIAGACLSGASVCVCEPPDTNGEVGPTQYVQAVNSSFAVFDKTGSVLKAATPVHQLWPSGFCSENGASDPVVLYDQLADRWVVSYLEATALTASTNGECIAVSTSPDATGTYYLYSFDFGGTLMDYPKLAVWPDAYYMTANEFPPNAQLSQGVGAWAFNRDQMLSGQTNPQFVFFDEGATNVLYCCQLPADLDGTTLPPLSSPGTTPAGSPKVIPPPTTQEYFVAVDDPSSLPSQPGFIMSIWKFHVDWSNTANSTFGMNGLPNSTLNVDPFVRSQCVYGHPPANCVPQKGAAGPAPEALDVLPGYLMFRAAYRNYGGHESLVLNHSVNVVDQTTQNTRIGIRWYEVRNPGNLPSIYQEGTYAPSDPTANPLWRWMGSAAMDASGDLALGYSASGPADFPTIRYAGRLVGDPLGTLPQTETIVPAGTVPYGGPQQNVQGRWGDYSDMTVDPLDDCTFWYTQEHLMSNGIPILNNVWRTNVVAFKFPTCMKTTAVHVARFDARWTKGGVSLSWRTGTEAEIAGFNVWRSSGKGWTRVNKGLVGAKKAGQAGGAGYRVLDRSAVRGRFYTYRLQVVDLRGARSWYGAGSVPVR